MLRSIWLIAKTVVIEAIRRREIYAIVLVSTLLIGAVMSVRFFDIEGLTKFYREVALKLMSLATALTVIFLAARQLPREFENRTIYPLMAKPISRTTFLAGKLLGVMLSAIFCFALFMVVFILGNLYLRTSIPWGLFLQFIYLQLILMLILATLSFWLSMLVNLDAAITIGIMLYLLAATLTSATSFIYDSVDVLSQKVLLLLTFILPQLTLFDLSEKTTHSQAWDPLGFKVMTELTVYGLVYAVIYFAFALFVFRRRVI